MRTSALVATGALAAAAVLGSAPATQAVDQVDTSALRKAVTVNGILSHERAFQQIANANGGTRASGTPGYTASVNYVAGRLAAAGYTIKRQQFSFPFYQELAPATLSQDSPTATDYETATFTYSGSGTVTGQLVPTNDVMVPPGPNPSSSSSGCEPSDFAPAPSGPSIALIQRGTCDFGVKSANARAAGYDAAIIFNEGQPGRTELINGTLGAPQSIPTVDLAYADGAALYTATQAGAVQVTVSTATDSRNAITSNLIADSPGGNANKVVVVGAHLDSVVEGAGINDNGSGSATILEIARQMSKLKIAPRQKVRFAFWGAEELGLLGSEHYVASLPPTQLSKIYANLNFDMLGSPNYVRFVYDGDGSDTPVSGPPGSGQIEQVFTSYFAGQGLASSPTEFSGRSDYGPFIAAGIPAGGLFSGAEGIKTDAEAATYGGTAGEAYDSCYHQACDTTNNLSTLALSEMGDAAAHATMTLAVTRSGLFPDGSKRAKVTPGTSASAHDGHALRR